MDTLSERIDDYTSYFERVLENIANIAGSEERATPVFRTILYFSCLESWAGDAFPRQGNRERFVRFLHEIAEWEYADRVSIPQLLHCTKPRTENELCLQRLSKIYDYSLSAAETSSKEDIEIPKSRVISDDPRVDDLISEIGIAGKPCVEPFQFSYLLWDCRNFVVHRFQFPGRATDVPGKKKGIPYYLPCGNALELILPVACLQKLCQHSLAKFNTWLKKREIDPFGDSELMTCWKRSG